MDDEADLRKLEETLQESRAEKLDEAYQEFIGIDDSDEDDSVYSVEDRDFSFDDVSDSVIPTDYKYCVLTSLTIEEKSIIDSCGNPDLKRILILNRQKNMQLIELYKKFKDLLIECKNNILDVHNIIQDKAQNQKLTSRASKSWRLGAPYFKDERNFPAPLNDEAYQKKLRDEQSLYDFMQVRKWSPHECEAVVRSVKLNYGMNLINHMRNQIKKLSVSNDENREAKILALEERQEELDDLDNPPTPPLGSDEHINWIRVSEVFLKEKHTDFECRSMWHMYLHPEINKSPWTSEEAKKMLFLVKKYKRQNWMAIAKELGSGRTCFGVFINYVNNYHKTLKKGEFTPAEDKQLVSLVRKYRVGEYIPWTQIARHFKNRHRSQLHHRFKYFLNHVDKKQGKFSLAEDCMIYLCIEKFGLAFSKVVEHLKQRSRPQIKSRYDCALKRKGKKITWTLDEDKRLVYEVEENGSTWGNVARVLERNSGQVRQRYSVIKRFLKANPDMTIVHVPRRAHFEDNKWMLIRQVAKTFLGQPEMPTLQEVEEVLNRCQKLPKHYAQAASQISTDENVDDLLTDFFWYHADDSPEIVPDTKEIGRIVDDVENLLNWLKVDLDIPKNLGRCSNLDSLDKKILFGIRTRKNKKPAVFSPTPITDCIPPNLYSVSGMRALLAKNFTFRSTPIEKIFAKSDEAETEVNKLKSEIYNGDLESNVMFKETIEMDRKLFFSRFAALFKWPAILTLQPPHKDLLSITKAFLIKYHEPVMEVKRTYNRKRSSKEIADTTRVEGEYNKVRIVENVRETFRRVTSNYVPKRTISKGLNNEFDSSLVPTSSSMVDTIKQEWSSSENENEEYVDSDKESTSSSNLMSAKTDGGV